MRFIAAYCLLTTFALGQSEWSWQKTPVPLALVINGIWWEDFQVGAALDRAGMRERREIKNLSQYSVIVLVNASVSRIPKGALADIREFVRQGGGLVVLGGLGAYYNGGYSDAAWGEILPVALTESYIEFYPTAEKGAKLTRAQTADWPLRLDFQSGPTAFYFHKLIPKSDAKVQVIVGDQPALVSGTFGKGRVVACSLTVNGNPEAGMLPFWKWKDWPALLGQAVEWAGEARPVGVMAEPPVKPLTLEELQAGLPKDLAKRAVVPVEEKTAKALFDLAVPASNVTAKCNLDAVLPAVLPYATPEWGARLTNLTARANPNLETRKAALTLLGACREPSAYGVLTNALADKRTELAAIDGLGRLGNDAAIPLLKSRFEEILKPARLPDFPERWAPLEFADASPPAAQVAVALYRLGDPDGVARLCELFRDVNFFDRVLWNGAYRSTPARVRAQLLDQAWVFLVENAGPIPASQGAAFVKYAATATDAVVIEFLVSAMEKSAGRPAGVDWKPLANAKSRIIVKMSQSRL